MSQKELQAGQADLLASDCSGLSLHRTFPLYAHMGACPLKMKHYKADCTVAFLSYCTTFDKNQCLLTLPKHSPDISGSLLADRFVQIIEIHGQHKMEGCKNPRSIEEADLQGLTLTLTLKG